MLISYSLPSHLPGTITWWAKTIYGLLLVSLIVWVINFFRVKPLKIERIEKEKNRRTEPGKDRFLY